MKIVSWNKNNNYFAIVCKRSIYVYSKNLVKICQFEEKFNIKSLIWTKDNLLVYTTLTHIKYGIINGENGILKCIDHKLWVVQFEKDELITFDTNSNIEKIKIDCDEFMLKSALFEKNLEKTKHYMNNLKSLGNSTIAYLYRKNYSGLAMNLVTDKKAKFSLAIDSGNLEIAFKTCNEVKEKEMFKQLGNSYFINILKEKKP